MRFHSIFGLLAVLASPSSALPADTPAVLEARQNTPPGTIPSTVVMQYCIDVRFNGCHWVAAPTGQCVTIPTGMSSIRAAYGYVCYIWTSKDCTGGAGGPVTFDDRHPDLGVWGFSDVTQSFRCTVAVK